MLYFSMGDYKFCLLESIGMEKVYVDLFLFYFLVQKIILQSLLTARENVALK